MAEISPQVDIPNRPLFKASEVCDLAKVQPYVLRSWEAEFKDLGVSKSGSTTRVYRREDVERVLRIKHLLLIEGLTLAGVRRKLEEETEPALEFDPPPAAAVVPGLSAEARERIGVVRQGLRSLLDLLDAPRPARQADVATAAGGAESTLFDVANDAPSADQRKAQREVKDESTKSASPRRKRSA
ncbi:MAG: MerR family transcriptional regulator [Vicinamibacterales bacterium]